MKILQFDDQTLKLRARSGPLLLILGILLILSTPLWIYFLGRSADLVCERTPSGSPRCTIERSLLGARMNWQPLPELTTAVVDEHEDSDGDALYQVVLETASGRIPLTSHSGSNYRHRASVAEEINAFLADAAQPSLRISDRGITGLIVSGVIGLVGLGLTIGGVRAAKTSWTFSLAEGTLTRSRATLTGAKTRTYLLDDIVEAHVGVSSDDDSDTYRVELMTRQGELIPLTGFYSSGYQGKDETVRLIRRFLNLN